MQQVTLSKLLILAAATYIAWSGLCCQWFRSFRHSLRRHFHHADDGKESQSQQGGFHLRHHHSKSMKDTSAAASSSNNDYASGIWFSKSIALVDDIRSPIEFQFSEDEEHCLLGENNNNECHYELGDVVSLNYTLQPTSSASESPYVEGSFLINDKLSWKFQCQLCGQDCQQQLDQFPLDLNISIDMPGCQDDESNNNVKKGSLSFALAPNTDSITTPLVLKGSLEVYSNSQSQSNELLAQIGMKATIA